VSQTPLPPVEAEASPPMPRATIIGIERSRILGYLYGILTAACWATSPVFIRKGLVGLPAPLWGTVIGLSAAASAYLVWLLLRHRVPGWHRSPVRRHGGRPARIAAGMMVLGAVASAVGSLGRTVALDLAAVVVVVPLVQTTSLWTMVFAPLILGRHVERISPSLVLGALLVGGGAALVIIGQNL
jgi:drug/metabolite transporter (DMT)-like permease